VTGRRRALGCVLLLLAVIAGCDSAPAATTTSTSPTSTTSSTTTLPAVSSTTMSPAPPAPIAWHPCDGSFRCGSLPVPVSYSDPSEGDIQLAVVELPAQGPDPVGDLVMNPGGPGGSGVSFLEEAYTEFPTSLRSAFNLVSFDPRGIGASEPVVCLPPSGIRQLVALPPAPESPAQVNEVVGFTRRFDAGCAASVPHDVLENLSTSVTAQDMDRLRAALGQEKLTYLGFSYGTYLGAVYAQLFPTHVRAMVLDGALDPAISTVTLEEQQAEGFEQDLHDFLDWCGSSRKCGAISSSGDPYEAFELFMEHFAGGGTLSARLAPDFGGTQTVDLGVFILAVVTGLYSPSSWPELGTALSQAENGDGYLLALFADEYAGQQGNGSFSNIVSAEAAIGCLDRPSPSGLSTYQQLATQLAALSPDFGAALAWGSLECAYWPIPPTGAPFTVHAPGLPPVLVVGSTRDPATPYVWAQELAAQLPGAVLLTRDGDGHTAYPYSSCVRSWVDGYLTSLTLPPAGTVCASDGNGLP
jgi:pimeloyl-ACP methyl ester carboxylesterase